MNKASLRASMVKDFDKTKNYLEITKYFEKKKNFKFRYVLWPLMVVIVILGIMASEARNFQRKESPIIIDNIVVNEISDDFWQEGPINKKGLSNILEEYLFIAKICEENGYIWRDFKEVGNVKIKYLLAYQKDDITLKIYFLQDDYELINYPESYINSQKVYLLEDTINSYICLTVEGIKVVISTPKMQTDAGMKLAKKVLKQKN